MGIQNKLVSGCSEWEISHKATTKVAYNPKTEKKVLNKVENLKI
jgi:hypothetical protein